MKIRNLKPALVNLPSAIVASLCCLLPLSLVLLGPGSGAFMAVTNRYSYIFIPVGLLGLAAGYFFYFREKRRCSALSCRMTAGTFNLVMLIVATMVVTVAVLLKVFPEAAASLLSGM
jgi:L-asparagine transporter-like permease